ncbi:helix-turn-helix domain-containing protein [Hoeflea alexandrii]|uniref:helix-turn-helix domain-containing protein n=1 Tax=Hoeflea alexandrii TaxID=288436 RepID=UPI0022AF0DFC|nr:helix-turn-helix domain-containing protein [Hoeflea alexandrii]MCZ4287269.1 helix-turn-helix domain-containing protein [Hoeflea alexandrii]
MDDDNILDEMGKLIACIEEDILKFDQGFDKFKSEIDEIVSGSMPRGYGDDDLIALPLVVYLPELGGSLTVNHDFSTIGTVSRKAIYAAIASGDLEVVKINKNFHVTKAALKDWIEACRSQSKNRAQSSAVVPLGTKTGSSHTEERSSSTMKESKLRQDAVSAMILSMQKRTKPQS